MGKRKNTVGGQIEVAEKSNKITAIPDLLYSPFIVGGGVIIDAIGTQTEIVKK